MPSFFLEEKKRVYTGRKGKKKSGKRVTKKRKVYLVGNRNPGRWVVSRPTRGSRPTTVAEPRSILPVEALMINAFSRENDSVRIEISFEGSHPRSEQLYQDIVFGGGQIVVGLDDRWPFIEEARLEIEEMVLEETDDILSGGIEGIPDIMSTSFTDSLGVKAAAIVAEKIRNMSSPPNAPATVRRKGFNNPLVETGTMQDSIVVDIERS